MLPGAVQYVPPSHTLPAPAESTSSRPSPSDRGTLEYDSLPTGSTAPAAPDSDQRVSHVLLRRGPLYLSSTVGVQQSGACTQ